MFSMLSVMLQLVVLMDPADDIDDILRQNRSREKQFMYDIALDAKTTQVSHIFNTSIISTIICHIFLNS